MKILPFIFVCFWGMISCRKSESSPGSKSRLSAIFADSSGVSSLAYTGNQVSGIDNIKVTHVDSNGSSYVNLNFPPQDSPYVISFKLRHAQLPSRIDIHSARGSDTENINVAKFFYKNSTDLLDSVVTWEGSTWEYFVYYFVYNGQNIQKVSRYFVTSYDARYPVDTFSFTYSNTPNAFRFTDSLLYIYTYPQTVFSAQPFVIATFFAETFSASTFNRVTIGSDPLLSPGSSNTYNMDITQNADGRVAKELIVGNGSAEGVYKQYYYQ